ncbi:MAG: hydrogenase subunit MbhD domain-containing protein [Candidatus Aerophobetes bacterium]|nr:hydrogenase subunit MbhD domain-containing protein [Candidatus Aerophobetes bacterium]
MIISILIVIVIVAILSLQFEDLLNAVIALAVFGFLLSLVFYLLHAPDVAITETAIRVGAATALFVVIINKIEREEE